MIVGIDEVGRGAWAGPLCIAAVGLGDVELPGLTDSKKLSIKKRDAFALEIKQRAPLVGIGWVSARDIDAVGMSRALKIAAARAFGQLDDKKVSQIIIDGTIMLLDDPRAITMKQADLLVPSVSAASVIAKVARDTYMQEVTRLFPDYGFEKHVGYGTAIHTAALEKIGPSKLHRMSFSPMSQAVKTDVKKSALPSDGSIAENAAAEYLLNLGYVVHERNWKTKWCEIDIIASKAGRIHFVEVKYRRSSVYGDGLDAITPKKLRQMKFAAELWLTRRDGNDAVLSVMSLSGDTFSIDELLDITA
jgi:ribonuclease HII